MRFAKRQRTWFRHQPPDVVWFSRADEGLEAALRWLDAG
jgi:tRNA A37 N6-isopentenylltransferase MiaA